MQARAKSISVQVKAAHSVARVVQVCNLQNTDSDFALAFSARFMSFREVEERGNYLMRDDIIDPSSKLIERRRL